MIRKRVKLFLEEHGFKLGIAAFLLVACAFPIMMWQRLDSPYTKEYVMLLTSFTPLTALIHTAIFMVGLYWLNYGGGRFAQLGTSRSAVTRQDVNVPWADVIGMDAPKQEAWEVIQLVKDRTRVQAIGGRIIRGILLVGPPGCGKTYLAKAMATETNLPFLCISASSFTEIFVGVGASRVRGLFKRARALAEAYGGCIIFIDEIDAVARRRVFSVFGGTEETNSTQNQLLDEMDGLKSRVHNLVVIGATNAPEDSLDEALLRPGRFDRKIYVDRPGLEDREKLFKFYFSKVKSDSALDFGRLARQAVYKTPADIENITKEAALIAAREHRDTVSHKEVSEAISRIDLGIKHKRTMNERERRMTAYHESGHLLVMYLLHPTDDVFKASIISRRDTLGVVHPQPREELYSHDRDHILADIRVDLAGYVAERLKFGVTTDGVRSDFQHAMGRAHGMVWRYGMGSNGFLGDYTLLAGHASARTGSAERSYLSDQLTYELNQETTRILQQCQREVEDLLKTEEVLLDRFAQELLARDELDYDEIEAIFKEYGKSNRRLANASSPKTSPTP